MSDLLLATTLVLQIGALCALIGTLYLLFFMAALESPKNLDTSLMKLLRNVLVVTQIGLITTIFSELVFAIVRLSTADTSLPQEIYFFRLALLGVAIVFGLVLSMTKLPKKTGYGILFLTWAYYFVLLTWSSLCSLISIWYLVGAYAFLALAVALARYVRYLQVNTKR